MLIKCNSHLLCRSSAIHALKLCRSSGTAIYYSIKCNTFTRIMSIKCNTYQTGRSRAMVSIFFRSNATITYFDMSINCNTFRMLSIKCNACNSCVDQVHYYLKESIKCLRGVIFVDQEPQLVVGCRSSALEVSRSSATLSKRSIKCNAFKNRSSAQPQSRSSASCPYK